MRVMVIATATPLATGKARFFVRQFGPDNCEYAGGDRYEVQVCAEVLRVAACVLFRGDDSELDLAATGYDIPRPVFLAAMRQPMGRGDFVDVQGKSVWPLL